MGNTANPVTTSSRRLLTWWLAAGLVGADIGTSVFYSTGVLLPHVGFAAPFFILLVMVSLWLFKTTYQEGCSVNPVNGGAYAMMLATIGRRTGLAIGSLTIISYLATAVVSALAGSYYLSSLWAGSWPQWLIVAIAAIPVVGFALLNLWGLKESTRIVFAIAAFHFVMLLVMDVWGLWQAFTQGAEWSRLWHGLEQLKPPGILLGFAAAFVGITGFESAAQIVEEIEPPRTASIKKVYLAIVILVSITAPISSLLAIVLLSEPQINTYKENMLSGLALIQGGQPWLILLVMNAMLTLFAAVNTAYAGVTGLLTTMSQQGNLPEIVLRRWCDRFPFLKGYPYAALPFMVVCLAMLAVFPGNVEQLAAIYGMAFLGVMISYCAGVILTRMYRVAKVARAQYVSRWVVRWRDRQLPLAPIIGGSLLVPAELILLGTTKDARDLGVILLLGVLLIMALYRQGVVERRMVQLPDLRLGMGRFRGIRVLPDDLAKLVLCISYIDLVRLVNLLSYLLKRHSSSGPLEIVVFHAQPSEEPIGWFEELQRLIAQQLEEFDLFMSKEFILTVKILPGNLVEVLPEYFKSNPFTAAYMGTGSDPERSERLRGYLSNELDLNVTRLDEVMIPKGPGVWFEQWLQERSA
ncbi:MAG: APC family permease [Cyanobacteria bacterium NC_groundwater_1444_Ag_S-0.65um_54_12]|nr:APC family permease [Cyanobacteria bacterium NC_groundwater_1444_Ag_S-0.65um_54_12]